MTDKNYKITVYNSNDEVVDTCESYDMSVTEAARMIPLTQGITTSGLKFCRDEIERVIVLGSSGEYLKMIFEVA